MTIQYASDLHFEIRANAQYLEEHPIMPSGDVLVLAGDIAYFGDEMYKRLPFWDWASDNYRKVLVIPGNHEFYEGYDVQNVADGVEIMIRENIHWCYNQVVTVDDIEFILSPLWSHVSAQSAFIIENRVADFKYIRYSGERLSPALFNRLHQQSTEFLMQALAQRKAKKCVVLSHHVPTHRCMADEFRGSILNGAFVAEMDTLIEPHSIDYWIYGHSHRNVGDVLIGNTRMVCNQLGYVSWKENLLFDPSKTFTL